MWEAIKVKRLAKIGSSTSEVEDQALQKEDGFTIFRTFVGREKQESFECRGSFDEFRFYASRCNADGLHVLNEYTVFTDLVPGGREFSIDRDTNRQLILTFAKDVESALLQFPPIFDYKPVRKVCFNLMDIRSDKPAQLVRADEIC